MQEPLGVVWFAGIGGRELEVEVEVEITIWCLWCGGKWPPLPLPSKTPKWVPPQNLWKWFTSIGTHFFDKYILKSFAYFHLYPHFIIPHTFLSLSSFPHLHTSFLSLLLPSPTDTEQMTTAPPPYHHDSSSPSFLPLMFHLLIFICNSLVEAIR